MAFMEMKGAGISIEITSTAALAPCEPLLAGWVSSLRALNLGAQSHCQELTVTNGAIGIWELGISLRDGRTWHQRMKPAPSGVALASEVSSYWSLAEIDLVRAMRTALLQLILAYNVTKVEVAWTA